MNRKTSKKIIIIAALVLVILTITLGFAVFSNTLTISSNATVTPNSEDFKIKIYGFSGNSFLDTMDINSYSSEIAINPLKGSAEGEATILTDKAKIDNVNLTINNINAPFIERGEQIMYLMRVVNEGKYDAYFDLEQLVEQTPISCVPAEGTTEILVQGACKDIDATTIFMTMEYLDAGKKYFNGEIPEDEFYDLIDEYSYWPGDSGIHKIEKGESVIVELLISYQSNNSPADGPFTATFEDIKLSFTTSNKK